MSASKPSREVPTWLVVLGMAFAIASIFLLDVVILAATRLSEVTL